jgi:hypothetical protein
VNDYFDRLEAHLLAAVEREARHTITRSSGPVSRRLSRLRRGSRGATAVLIIAVLAGGTTGALAAAGVFRTGTPVGPDVASNANAVIGVAVPRSVRVLPISVNDPAGGEAWGLRFQRTTRGLACLQPGRLQDGRIGVLGQDGLFGDDGRFHPLAVNYYSQYGGGCADADTKGDAVFNTLVEKVPAAGIQGEGLCLGTANQGRDGPCQSDRPLAAQTSPADERLLLYGLLGPDATSISYTTPSGSVATQRTVGAEGAYLIVEDVPAGDCARWGSLGCGEGAEYQTPLQSYGVIRAVTYRNGHTCRMPTAASMCPAVGYAKPPEQHVTPAEVRAPIHVNVSSHWYQCYLGHQERYCQGAPTPGYRRILAPPRRDAGGQMRATVSFVSRVAVKNVDNDYLVVMRLKPTAQALRDHTCTRMDLYAPDTAFDQTNYDIRTGQQVVAHLYWYPTCRGVMRGTVTYLTATGRTDPFGAVQQASKTIVGTFSFQVP